MSSLNSIKQSSSFTGWFLNDFVQSSYILDERPFLADKPFSNQQKKAAAVCGSPEFISSITLI
jgi:hypothetical protein